MVKKSITSIQAFIPTEGDDTFLGANSNQTVHGWGGNDTLIGGNGADTLYGDSGNDTLRGGNAKDFIYGGVGDDTLYGDNGNDLLSGDDGADYLYGGNGVDTLLGGSGDDFLNGGLGGDKMMGGEGNDIYVVDSVPDMIIENAGQGIDTVRTSLAKYTLGSYLENLEYLGSKSFIGTGNTLDNQISGGSGNDTLYGGAGDDTLDGKAGADKMFGGVGNDKYYVDNIGDVATEAFNEGIDAVESTISYTLAGKVNIENLTLLGTTAINGTGNAGSNILTGNSGANILTGGNGDDVLNGGLGNDTLLGGEGNDTFKFTTALDPLSNVDMIVDFGPGNDIISLNDTIFEALSTGITDADIRSDAGASTAIGDEHLIYDTASGALYYDADGANNDKNAILFAYVNDGVNLMGHPTLTAANFTIAE